jgi:hypothetical protein
MDTTHRQIVDYWTQHQDECGLSIDWAEADELCWRCAQSRKLQRCHIVPRALGGSECPSNLILLCGQCHAEAPNVEDPDFMWTWLRAHASSAYGSYWYQRGFREYEFVYRKKPFAGLERSDAMLIRLNEEVGRYIRRTNTHWGQGKLNPATIAWLLRHVEKALSNEA